MVATLDTLNDLDQVLESLAAFVPDLADAIGGEKKAVLSFDLGALHESHRALQEKVGAIQGLVARKRTLLVNLGVPIGNKTVAALKKMGVSCGGVEVCERICERIHQVRDLGKMIASQAEQLNYYLAGAMSHTQQSLMMINRCRGETLGPVYDRSGGTSAMSSSPIRVSYVG